MVSVLVAMTALHDSAAEERSSAEEAAVESEPIAQDEAPPEGEPTPLPHADLPIEWSYYWDSQGFHYEVGNTLFTWLELHEIPDTFKTSKVKGRVGGKLQVDAAGFATKGALPEFEAGAELRRFRLYTSGQLFFLAETRYKFEFQVTQDQVSLSDFYLAWELGSVVQELKVGHFTAPLSLEALASSLDTTFMEVAGPVSAFSPSLKSGIQLDSAWADERITGTIGMFGPGTNKDIGDALGNSARAVARITGLPWCREANEEAGVEPGFLHLGLAASYVFSPSEEVRYRTRPESHIAPYVLDTRALESRNALVYGVEAAWVDGPFSLQSEFIESVVEKGTGEFLTFYGAYIQGSWILTGETRPYQKRRARFSGIDPDRPFHACGTFGALELALRLSHTALSDEDVQGGRMTNFTTGLVWHLNHNLRTEFNYVFSRMRDGLYDGDVHTFQARVQLAF